MYAYVVAVGVVGEYVILSDALLPYRDHLQPQPVEDEPLVAVLSEDHLFAVAQHYGPVRTVFLVRNLRMGPVVEDDAVGEHLHD